MPTESSTSAVVPKTPAPKSKRPSGITWFVGVILPVGCAWLGGAFQGPRVHNLIPFVDLIGVLGVALGNFALLRPWPSRSPHLTAFLGGWALGFSIYYTIVMAPLIPLGIMAIVFFLLGLLIVAPLLTAIVAYLYTRKFLFANSSISYLSSVMLIGATLGVLVPGYSDLKIYLTARRINVAQTQKGAARANALRWLRSSADRTVVHTYCPNHKEGDYGGQKRYEDSYGDEDIFAFVKYAPGTSHPRWFHPSPWKSKGTSALEYAITGAPYFHSPYENPPSPIGSWIVAEIRASKIEGVIEPESAVANLTWHISLEGVDNTQGPALFRLLLPEGAVITSAVRESNSHTYADREPRAVEDAAPRSWRQLGFDMLKRRTAFFRVANISSHYRSKIRIDLKVPLVREQSGEGRLELPALASINLLTESLGRTQLSLSSDMELLSNAPKIKVLKPQTLEGRLPLEEPPGMRRFWIRARIKPSPEAALKLPPDWEPRPLIVVVDVGLGMKPYLDLLAQTIDTESEHRIIELVAAHDTVLTANDKESMLKLLAGQIGRGGFDSAPALSYAIERAQKIPNAAVLWICGRQQLTQTSLANAQPWLREQDSVAIFAINPMRAQHVVLNQVLRYGNCWRIRYSSRMRNAVNYALATASRARKLN